MRLDRFDLNLLVALDIILEECNVTRASVRLNVGQSAASAALSRLRDYFGDELLVPVAGRLVRTPMAESLVEPVRDILMRSRATLARRPGFDPASSDRSFLMCASDYAITVFLPKVVRRVAALAPQIRLDIRSNMRDVFELFGRGTIDLLFSPEPYVSKLSAPKLRLFEDTHVCMVWAGNTMVEGDSLSLDQYLAMGHIAVHFGDESSLAFEEWYLPRHGKQRQIEVRVDNFGTIPLVLVGTNRIATLHRKQAEHFGRYFPVRLLDTPFVLPSLVEVMSWPAHLEHDPAHTWLRSVIHDCVNIDQASATKPDALTISPQRA